MENAEHFGTLTKRMEEFPKEGLDEKPISPVICLSYKFRQIVLEHLGQNQ